MISCYKQLHRHIIHMWISLGTPLQLVTGKSCNLPDLTMGNVASQIVSDTEAVQKVLESILKTTSSCREAIEHSRLKDCQNLRVEGYQHQGS